MSLTLTHKIVYLYSFPTSYSKKSRIVQKHFIDLKVKNEKNLNESGGIVQSGIYLALFDPSSFTFLAFSQKLWPYLTQSKITKQFFAENENNAKRKSVSKELILKIDF